MTEIRILTLHSLAATGTLDDAPLRTYLRDREVLRSEPFFFFHEGRPACLVYLETRPLQGADQGVPARRAEQKQGEASGSDERSADEKAVDEAFRRLLSELDETERSRYQRLLVWRRDAARQRNQPPYVLFTNRQALELARRAPASLAALGQIKGLGEKRLNAHGKAILEVLHGTVPPGRSGAPAPVREVDGHHQVAAGANPTVPQAAPAHADGSDRVADPPVPGVGDPGGLPQGSNGATA